MNAQEYLDLAESANEIRRLIGLLGSERLSKLGEELSAHISGILARHERSMIESCRGDHEHYIDPWADSGDSILPGLRDPCLEPAQVGKRED